MKVATTSVFGNYDLNDTVQAELNNNLTIVNSIVGQKGLIGKPNFFILGGAALIFHNLNYLSTLDIDTANRIEDSVREDVSQFVSDLASEVSVLPFNYESRAERIRLDLTFINVYILSKEDLLLSKIYSARRKDLKAVCETGLLRSVDLTKVSKIARTEFETTPRLRLLGNANMIGLKL